MTVFRLKYVKAFADRHGKRRYYYRRPGCVAVALPGEPGSKAFMEAYHAAADGAVKREIGAAKIIPGSLSDLIARYYQSSAYKKRKAITQRTYRNTLERLRKAHGDLLVRGLKRKHVTAMLEALADKPGAQYDLRRVLRIILKLAMDLGWVTVHPMAEMRAPRKAVEGFRAWTEEDIAAYERKWPTGSRERLALALLLYTGQRRSDVVLMGRQHVADGRIRVKQQKTDTELVITLHAALKAEIEAAPKEHLTFLTTAYGKPFSPAGFTNWFVESAKAADLPPKSAPHGLRKAAARRLAEAGCTPSEIMAITGHKNLSEVTLYTASADQARLADEAMRKVEKRTKMSNPDRPVRQSGRKAE